MNKQQLVDCSTQARERTRAAGRSLREVWLPRVADLAGRLPRLFAPAPVAEADESHFLPNFCRGRAVFGPTPIAA